MTGAFFLAIFFSFITTACNALSAVWQRRATGQVSPSELFRGKVIRNVYKKRLWVAGISLNVVGFFAQAVALHNGPLVLVEPLLTTDIVFLLIFLHFGRTNVRVDKRAFLGAILIIVGLSCLTVIANPQGGSLKPVFWLWMLAIAVVGGLIFAGSLVMRTTRNIPLRAGVGGVTAGLHFGLTAAVTKLVMVQLQNAGVMGTLISWQLAALLIVGASSALTMQSMYGAGPLAITQPGLEITEALVGITIGIVLFGDSANSRIWALAAEAFSGLVVAVGIVMLTGSKALEKQSSQLRAKQEAKALA